MSVDDEMCSWRDGGGGAYSSCRSLGWLAARPQYNNVRVMDENEIVNADLRKVLHVDSVFSMTNKIYGVGG